MIELLTPVDAFILAATLTDTPYLMAARVVSRARILLLHAATLRRQLSMDPALSMAMLASLAAHYRGLVRQVKNLKLRSAIERLDCYLATLATLAAQSPRLDAPTRLPFDKRRLASQLGMTPETLSRAIATLRAHGVEVDGGAFTINDVQRLGQLCRPDHLMDQPEKDLRVEVD